MKFCFKDRSFELGKKTYVMAIMNVTPDSFSENGVNFALNRAVENAKQMIAAGVDVIDVGGESTRPGAPEVGVEEEISRVVPFIKALRGFSDIPVSIDTWKSEVAEAAIEAGADIINDVTGFHRDKKLKDVAAKYGVGCIAMHMRGTPKTMQNPENLQYVNLVADICDYFKNTVDMLKSAGVDSSKIMLDPGVGFSKNCDQNLELVKELSKFRELGYPVFLGPSRKSFIGQVLDIKEPEKRVWGTAAVIAVGIRNGADMVRIHDFEEMIQVAGMADSLRK